MFRTEERYVVDENGNRVGVILDVTDYEEFLGEPRRIGIYSCL